MLAGIDLGQRLAFRQQSFMRTPDVAEAKRKREDADIALRKQKRMEGALKRRNIDGETTLQSRETHAILCDLPTVLAAIARNQSEATMQAAISLRKLLSAKVDPPIQQVIDAGLIPVLLVWLQRGDVPELQYEACWALTNIASGSHMHAFSLVSKGVVPISYELLRSPIGTIREQAIWLLGNLAGDCTDTRDAILQTNGLRHVLAVVQGELTPSLRRNASWTVSNLCRGKPQPKSELVICAVPFLASMVQTLDLEAVSDPLWALSNLCATKNDRIQALIDTQVVGKLAEFVRNRDEGDRHKMLLPALRCLGNIASGNAQQTQVIVDLQLVPVYRDLLRAERVTVRKEAAWTVSNLAAGTRGQLEALVNADVFITVIDILPEQPESVQSELLWALHNAAMCDDPSIVFHVVHNGAVSALSHLLSTSLPQTLYQTLDVIKSLLEGGKRHLSHGGENPVSDEVERTCLDRIESLQTHPNQQVYLKAQAILEGYFELAEPSDELTATILSLGQFEL